MAVKSVFNTEKDIKNTLAPIMSSILNERKIQKGGVYENTKNDGTILYFNEGACFNAAVLDIKNVVKNIKHTYSIPIKELLSNNIQYYRLLQHFLTHIIQKI